jgi:hypothetical protein
VKSAFGLIRSIVSVFILLPVAASAVTVVVDGNADNPGAGTFQKLSSAVAYVQSTGPGPHTINIIVDQLPVADGEVVINTPMTINGDADGNGVKCDILVDMAGILALATSAGNVEKCYIEVQTAGTVNINNLKIHPNADASGTAAANSVDGLRAYRPVNVGEVGNYIFDHVWFSGSNESNQYVDLDTGDPLYLVAGKGMKRWCFASTGASAVGGVFQLTRAPDPGGTYNAELIHCMAGISGNNAMNIPAEGGGTVVVTGGLYGHCARDGIRVSGTGVTLTGSPTNRLRVVRSTSVSAGDGHTVEIDAGSIDLMQYVDAAGCNTSQQFKFGNAGSVTLMQYCRGLGKLSPVGNNHTNLVNSTFQLNNVRKCTFVGTFGGTNSQHPFTSQGGFNGEAKFYDCIFTSDDVSAYIQADNVDTVGGITLLDHCGIPTDGVVGESLADPPIRNLSAGQSANIPTPINPVNVSPGFIKKVADYDWSQAAVSEDGSNPLAGNPDVYRPSNTAYRNAASDGTHLTGGAGGNYLAAVGDWSIY